MANTISQRNFIRDRLINNTPKVVILEDMSLVREEIQQFIENELGWQVIIAKNCNEAVKFCESQEAEFYILDIKLGNERSRSQEGMDTAEAIKAIDENVFVSIFSDYSQSQEFQKRAKKVGVNYFQAKSSPVQEGVSRIAIEMLLFQKNLLDGIFQKYLHSSAYLGEDEILKIVNKIKEVNNKLEDIQKLESRAGRTRWLTENENHNILKNRGYHLEHNFGHGKQHLASVLLTLNLLAFLLHTVLGLVDERYQRIRVQRVTRKGFFQDILSLTKYLFFEVWHHLLDFMLDDPVSLAVSNSS